MNGQRDASTPWAALAILAAGAFTTTCVPWWAGPCPEPSDIVPGDYRTVWRLDRDEITQVVSATVSEDASALELLVAHGEEEATVRYALEPMRRDAVHWVAIEIALSDTTGWEDPCAAEASDLPRIEGVRFWSGEHVAGHAGRVLRAGACRTEDTSALSGVPDGRFVPLSSDTLVVEPEAGLDLGAGHQVEILAEDIEVDAFMVRFVGVLWPRDDAFTHRSRWTDPSPTGAAFAVPDPGIR